MTDTDLPGKWWTAPAEAESGDLILVTGRSDIDKFRRRGKFSIRVEVAWKYADSGLPADNSDVAALLGEIDTSFHRVLAADPVAVLTGIFTGDGERTWVFYTVSTNLFQKKLNEALAPFPLLPLQITAENDHDWLAYAEMAELEVQGDD